MLFIHFLLFRHGFTLSKANFSSLSLSKYAGTSTNFCIVFPVFWEKM